MKRSILQRLLNAPCTCEWLTHAAEDPGCSIEFDARLNEYHLLQGPADARGHMMLYYCPFCGGRAPVSSRESLFADVPKREYDRLFQLVSGVRTVEAAIAKFGPYDEATEGGMIPGNKRQPKGDIARHYKIFVWKGLSETVDVGANVFSPDDINFGMWAKHIGEKP